MSTAVVRCSASPGIKSNPLLAPGNWSPSYKTNWSALCDDFEQQLFEIECLLFMKMSSPRIQSRANGLCIANPARCAFEFKHSPLLVFYELTRSCDLVCLHCRACAQREPAPDELKSVHSHQLINEIASFPTAPLLVFTGGDPFKRRDLLELVQHAADVGLEVAVTPSATPLVTKAALQALQQAGASRIAVSLDGPDAVSHDGFRGVVGSFQRTLEIIDDAGALGLPVQVNTTVTPGNCAASRNSPNC